MHPLISLLFLNVVQLKLRLVQVMQLVRLHQLLRASLEEPRLFFHFPHLLGVIDAWGAFDQFLQIMLHQFLFVHWLIQREDSCQILLLIHLLLVFEQLQEVVILLLVFVIKQFAKQMLHQISIDLRPLPLVRRFLVHESR